MENYLKLKLNSVAWVRERTMLTELPPLVDEVSANFSWSARRNPTAVISIFWTAAATFFFQVPPRTHEADWTPFQTHYFS
jgi:hypothetical protein